MGGVGEREAGGKIMISFCKAFFFLKCISLLKGLSYFCKQFDGASIECYLFVFGGVLSFCSPESSFFIFWGDTG